jgi:hypothetical protein
MYKLDFSGVKVGKLTGIEVSGKTKNGTLIWTCICERGRECKRTSSCLQLSIKGKWNTCCGICSGTDGAFRKLFYIYKRNAKLQSREWSLTEEQFRTLTSSPCYYTGRLPANVYKHWTTTYVYNGVDRVDNNKGYTIENCLPCCHDVNFAKGRMLHSDFIQLCKEVTQYKTQTQKDPKWQTD